MIFRLNTLKAKLITGMATVLVLLLLQGVVLWKKADTVESNSLNLQQLTLPVMTKSLELKLVVVQVQQWLTDISATRGQDGLDDGFAMAAEQARVARGLVEALSLLEPERAGDLALLGQHFESYYQAGQKMARAYVEGGPEAGNALMGGFDAAAETLQDDIARLVEHARQLSGESLARSVDFSSRGKQWVVTTVVVLVLFVLAAAVFMHRVVIRSLCQTEQLASQLAEGDGDLTRRLDEGRNDEIGHVSRSINRFVAGIAQLVGSVNSVAAELGGASTGLLTLAQEGRGKAGRQLQETEAVSTAMTEMRSSAEEIANTVAEAARISGEAARQTEQGNGAVHNATRVIKKLESEIEKAQGVINQLSDDSSNIGSVLDVIRGISEQTNLLALNAAIEAARAGEQGRGFAVVADEVRTLASRTQQSTEEIHAMISTLQARASESVSLMAGSREMAVSGVAEVERALTVLEEIRAGVNDIQERTTHIATAAGQQSVVSGEMDQNVVRIAELARETSGSAEQIASASEQLSSMARQIDALLGRFKLG